MNMVDYGSLVAQYGVRRSKKNSQFFPVIKKIVLKYLTFCFLIGLCPQEDQCSLIWQLQFQVKTLKKKFTSKLLL